MKPSHRPITRRLRATVAGVALACLGVAATPAVAQEAPGDGDGAGTVAGTVLDQDGAPVSLVDATLLTGGDGVAGAGERQLVSATTDGSGRFSLDVARSGCHRVVLSGPAGSAFVGGDGPVIELAVCPGAGSPTVEVNATLQVATTHLAGRLVDEAGAAVPGGAVTVRTAIGDGTGGSPVTTTVTGPEGWFDLTLPPGCYVTDLEPPAGRWFVGGRRSLARTGCLDGGHPVYLADGVVEGTGSGPGTAPGPVEWELVRLTNELRADPSGPLARPEPEPACVTDEVYEIEIDPATGHPSPVGPLTIDLAVADTLARPWATELGAGGELRHRPSGPQEELYHLLGLEVALWGENVAWARDYPVAEVAMAHFTGWRDSDEGHYCALVSDGFTHVGVGEVTVDGTSWAVQNFYRLQSDGRAP